MKAYLNWSSGKDAALAFYELQTDQKIKIDKLVTTVNSQSNRISMHGVRMELLELQAQSIGLPLQVIQLDGDISMEAYSRIMLKEVEKLKKEGYTHSVFGDIFLEDLREYREAELTKAGLKAVFPLWKTNTGTLMKRFIEEGFKAVTVCINSKVLDKSFCGRTIDLDFLNSLPEGVDPCGENGEFHTFVYDGPIFKKPIEFAIGEMVERSYRPTEEGDDCFKEDTESWDTSFWYCDLVPKERTRN